jgi:hypothetical protein
MTKVKLLASLALVLSLLSVSVFPHHITCLNTFTTLEAFVDCLDKHTVPANFYNDPGYATAQPSGSEAVAWKIAVEKLLTGGCLPGSPGSPIVTPVAGLGGDYVIAGVTESGGTHTWCILVEAHTLTGSLVYKRGWGFVVTPADPVHGVIRDLHFSAPHPQSDENTPRQAAVLFKKTGAKSLVVTGRNRKAYPISTLCSTSRPPDVFIT